MTDIALPEDFPIVTSGRSVQRDDPISHLHLHQMLELGYCHAGSGIFVVEDKVLPYRAGCVSVINEREMHLAQSTPGTTSTWTFLSVDPARLLAGVGVDPAMLDTSTLGGRGFENIIPPERDPDLCGLISLLATETERRATGHRDAVRGLMLASMACLHRLPGQGVASGERGALRRLAPALGYLGAHYHDAMSIPMLAAVCGLSPTHFRRLFSAAFGQAPLTYVVRFRLEKAAALLRDGRTSVLQAALRCGFNSQSAFQRHFRTVFGCPPRAWRQRT